MTTSDDNAAVAYPRNFVTPGEEITGWEMLEPYYQILAEEPIDSPEELKTWLEKWSELRAIADEHVTRRYIDMTCHTDNEQMRDAYLVCVREVEPKLTEWDNKLDRRYVESPHRSALEKKTYGQLDRIIETSIKLFDEKNIPVQVKLQELSHRYQEIMGSMMVKFDGEEKTMPQMRDYLRRPDRAKRKEAFVATALRRMEERDQLDNLFDEMLVKRAEYADNLGLSDYREYCFLSKLRDYTPDDCMQFHEAIEKTAIPLAKKITESRRTRMGLDKLDPWDTDCDELGREPLKPFETPEQLSKGTGEIFMALDNRLGAHFESIKHSMDLDSRKGKAPGGYQTTLSEARMPFIFTNAVGSHNDVNTLLHEGGHAFHTLQSRDQSLIWYRHAAMEFSEVASMTQELLGGSRLEPFYGDAEDRNRARQEHLQGVVYLFGAVAKIDLFQHWVYTHPNHTQEERTQEWLNINQRFSTGVDWSNAPEGALASSWHRVLHIFEVPFYYVEYAIAQLGALQIYREFLCDNSRAIDNYLSALTLGGSATAPELFAAAGVKFDFSEKLMAELMKMIEKELDL